MDLTDEGDKPDMLNPIVNILVYSYVGVRHDGFSTPDEIKQLVSRLNLTQSERTDVEGKLYTQIRWKNVPDILQQLTEAQLKVDDVDTIDLLESAIKLFPKAESSFKNSDDWTRTGRSAKQGMCRKLFSKYVNLCKEDKPVIENAKKVMADMIEQHNLVFDRRTMVSLRVEINDLRTNLLDRIVHIDSLDSSVPHFHMKTLVEQSVSLADSLLERFRNYLDHQANFDPIVCAKPPHETIEEGILAITRVRMEAMRVVKSNMKKVWRMFPDKWINTQMGVDTDEKGRAVITPDFRERIYQRSEMEHEKAVYTASDGEFLVQLDTREQFQVYINEGTTFGQDDDGTPDSGVPEKRGRVMPPGTKYVLIDPMTAKVDSKRNEVVLTVLPGEDLVRHVFFERLGDGRLVRYVQHMSVWSRELREMTEEFGEMETPGDEIVVKSDELSDSFTLQEIKKGRYIMDILKLESYLKTTHVRGANTRQEEIRKTRLSMVAERRTLRSRIFGRPENPETSERPERPERPENPDKPDKPEKRNKKKKVDLTFGFLGNGNGSFHLGPARLEEEDEDNDRHVVNWIDTLEGMFSCLRVLKFKEEEYTMKWTSEFLCEGDMYLLTDGDESFHRSLLAAVDECLLDRHMIDSSKLCDLQTFSDVTSAGSCMNFLSTNLAEIYNRMVYTVRLVGTPATDRGITGQDSPYLDLFEHETLIGFYTYVDNAYNALEFFDQFGVKQLLIDSRQLEEVQYEEFSVSSNEVSIPNVRTAMGKPPLALNKANGYNLGLNQVLRDVYIPYNDAEEDSAEEGIDAEDSAEEDSAEEDDTDNDDDTDDDDTEVEALEKATTTGSTSTGLSSWRSWMMVLIWHQKFGHLVGQGSCQCGYVSNTEFGFRCPYCTLPRLGARWSPPTGS